jgi:hypothetical protein
MQRRRNNKLVLALAPILHRYCFAVPIRPSAVAVSVWLYLEERLRILVERRQAAKAVVFPGHVNR